MLFICPLEQRICSLVILFRGGIYETILIQKTPPRSPRHSASTKSSLSSARSSASSADVYFESLHKPIQP